MCFVRIGEAVGHLSARSPPLLSCIVHTRPKRIKQPFFRISTSAPPQAPQRRKKPNHQPRDGYIVPPEKKNPLKPYTHNPSLPSLPLLFRPTDRTNERTPHRHNPSPFCFCPLPQERASPPSYFTFTLYIYTHTSRLAQP